MPTPPLEPSDADSAAPTQAASTPARDAAEVTGLLRAWAAGDQRAIESLLPVVYEELRRQAGRAMRREASGHTLQPTDLLHEAFLRLVDQQQADWQSRAQFYAVAAQTMRRVLVDHARARRRVKRGGGATHVTLDESAGAAASSGGSGEVDVLALDEALSRLAEVDPRKARLVELRYFAGLTIPEASAALGISAATVGREWAVARAWLRRELAS